MHRGQRTGQMEQGGEAPAWHGKGVPVPRSLLRI